MATDTAAEPDRGFANGAEPLSLSPRPVERTGARHFARRFIETPVAMMIGTMVPGALESGVLSAFGAALALFRCSVIHANAVGGVSMGAMVPAMLGVMLLRRSEYSQPVHKQALASPVPNRRTTS